MRNSSRRHTYVVSPRMWSPTCGRPIHQMPARASTHSETSLKRSAQVAGSRLSVRGRRRWA